MITFMIVGGVVSSRLKRKFKKYSKIATHSGLSGKEIAEKMLSDNNISDVKVISVVGKLTDHYNPIDKTVNLSPDVYQGRHVSAAAVAAPVPRADLECAQGAGRHAAVPDVPDELCLTRAASHRQL